MGGHLEISVLEELPALIDSCRLVELSLLTYQEASDVAESFMGTAEAA